MAKRKQPARARARATVSGTDVSTPLDAVRSHAFSTLSSRQRIATNLYVDTRIFKQGEFVGPRRQAISVRRPSLLVFADDDPRANFAHECRYFLYDAASGALDRIVPAAFPPVRQGAAAHAEAISPAGAVRQGQRSLSAAAADIPLHPPPHRRAIRNPLRRHVEQAPPQRHGIPLPGADRHLLVRPGEHPRALLRRHAQHAGRRADQVAGRRHLLPHPDHR